MSKLSLSNGNILVDGNYQDAFASKVDKVTGKTLIESTFANGVSKIESQEILKVEQDKDGKVIRYLTKDGTIVYPGNVKVLGTLSTNTVRHGGVRFLQISDMHYNQNDTTIVDGVNCAGRMEIMVEEINNQSKDRDFDFIISTGDSAFATLQNGVRDANLYKFATDIMSKFPCRFFPVCGNHDAYNDAEWFEAFGMPKQYSVDLGSHVLIVANVYKDSLEWCPVQEEGVRVWKLASECTSGNFQRGFRYQGIDVDYLEAQLKMCKDLGKEPIFAAHTIMSTNIDNESDKDSTFLSKNYNQAISMLNFYGCKLVLVGHSHLRYNRQEGEQVFCNSGWFGDLRQYSYTQYQDNKDKSSWGLNVFDAKGGDLFVKSVRIEHDYSDTFSEVLPRLEQKLAIEPGINKPNYKI